MQRYCLLAGLLATLLTAFVSGSTPALAITAKQKMETCKFGADAQKLTGTVRAAFLKKCMSTRNDPRGPVVGSPAATGAPTAPEEEETEPNK